MYGERFQTLVFDALAAAGVLNVEVEFDAFGDAAEYVSITTNTAEMVPHSGDLSALPFSPMAMFIALTDDGDLETVEFDNLERAVEDLVFGCMIDNFDAPKSDESAHCTFVIDVAARTICCNHDERVIEVA